MAISHPLVTSTATSPTTSTTSTRPTTTLTKADFLRYLTCPAWAWVTRHQPQRLPPPDPIATGAAERGLRIAIQARALFPGGVRIADDYRDDVAAQMTTTAVHNGATTLYRAAAATRFGLVARADVLVKEGRGWHLYEFRSATASRSDPRKIQKRFLDDLAFQVHAFSDAGFSITSATVVHLNGAYRRHGQLDARRLFQFTDLTSAVRGVYDAVGRAIERAIADLNDGALFPECACQFRARHARCDLFPHFHPEFPATDSVLDLHLTRDRLQRALAGGITSLHDWPDDLPLADHQRAVVAFRRRGHAEVDRRGLVALLGEYRYPLAFLDFETSAPPIPLYEGTGPFEPIPFQFSLHTVREDGAVTHRQFLWTQRGVDPVPALLDALLPAIESAGTVLAWNAGYEKGCNARMAERFPTAAPALHVINDRMRDLGDIIKQGHWRHPAFRGSWSLKNVLPVAAPGFNHRDLAIGEGGVAAERWMQAVLDDETLMTAAEREAIFGALLEYCHLDTLGMVHIWQHAHELCDQPVCLQWNAAIPEIPAYE